jgi:uncharacterized protein (TIGR00369 family)
VLERTDGDPTRYAIVTDRRHGNRNGVVHGGVLMTLADKAAGTIARRSAKIARAATVQLDQQFVRRVDVGDFVEARCEIVRAARSLVFITCLLSVGAETVGTTSVILNYRRAEADVEKAG